jgi:two-component system, LytTR family, response regulator
MALKVLILEDEQPAVDHITNLLKVYDKTIQILAVFDSVKDVAEWLKVNPPPDLIFMDIQVADGLCFDVFGKVDVISPVIFITAYQEYAIRAFKVNSIDYLLKPIDLVGLKDALEKYSRLYSSKSEVPVIHPSLIDSVRKLIEKPYKNRFVIKVGEHLRSVSTSDILCFYSQEKVTHICTSDKRVLIVDYSLDQIMELIDPEQFFRISRKTIVNRDAITDIVVWSKTRLKIKLSIDLDEPAIVSREKVNPFKEWLEK